MMSDPAAPKNGAELLRDTLIECGVHVCFANPGTSEMHFVAALDRESRMRCVLGLQENVVTGAADGYGRMSDRPAVTLLHLGPGLANGLANLHNARRAHTPIVNVVGDHATAHLALDAPLTSDIESLARPMSDFVRRVRSPDDVAAATVDAHRAACGRPGIATSGVATLILPADASWGPVSQRPPHPAPAPSPAAADFAASAVEDAARTLQARVRAGARIGFLLAGRALRRPALTIAGVIADALGARLLCEPLTGRLERGAGTVPVEKIPYPIASAIECLASLDLLVLVGTKTPVGFFAYPGMPGRLTAEHCEIVTAAAPADDPVKILAHLRDCLSIPQKPPSHVIFAPPAADLGGTALTPEIVCTAIAAGLPDGAILCDEALTATAHLHGRTRTAAPHDYLQVTGGAIGIGPPLAVGAAIACPDRKVINVQADGSAMYTIQALWTQARERLNVLTIILANRSYAILHHEMRGVGVTTLGRNSRRMLDIDDPALDFVQIARGLGVEAVRAGTPREFAAAYARGLAASSPFLIEAVL
jgi:acetolactate synthase-1/2/3 large subunit